MSFSDAKFAKFFVAASLMAAATFAIGNIIQVVSSWYLGADAFAAMAAVYPYRLLPDVLVVLIAEGSAVLSAQAMGRSDHDTANRIFSQGTLLLTGIGIVFTLGFHAFEGVYLDLMGVTGEVRVQALAFGSGFVFSILSGMLQDYLRVQVYADGGRKFCLVGSLAYLVVHAVTAVLFVSRWGARGLGLSVAAATCAYLGILLLHFRTKAASLRLKPSFSLPLLMRTCALGLGSLLPQMSTILISFVMTRVAAARFGAVGLAVVAVVNGIGSLTGFLQAVGLVALPFAAVYFGEDNRPGLVATMRRAAGFLLGEGLLLALPLLFFPSRVAGLFGIDEPATRAAMVDAVRWIGAFLIPAGFAALWGTYLQATGRERIAGAYAFFRSLVFPSAAIFAGISFCGASGLAAALSGEALFLIVAGLIGRAVAAWKGLTFPLCLRPSDRDGLLFSLKVTGEEAARAAARIGEVLEGRFGLGDHRTMWASLATEELLTVIHDLNPRQNVRAELTLDFPEEDTVRLIIRDDGEIFDFSTVASDVNSLSAYVLVRLTCGCERNGMATTGSNRSVLIFKNDNPKEKEETGK